MPIIFKQKGEVMSDAAKVLAKLKKDMGDQVGRKGVELISVPRIPTGIFPLDLATGGGFPKGRLSIIHGIESSCKTALSYLLMAQIQREGKKAVYVDLEHTMDATWAVKFGLDIDELIIITPGFAEQTVDVVEAMLYAEDVGIVVVDSIAAMTTDNEIASSAEKMNVGGASYIVGKMVRKAITALSRESHSNHFPALVCLNQQRVKIGQMFGDPTTMPGGNSLKFASSLTLKLYGKDEIVKEVHAALPTYKVITGTVQKSKVPILSKAFEYNISLLPHGNLKVGQCPSWAFVSNYCKNAGLLTQAGVGKPWILLGKSGATQKELRQIYETDIPFSQAVHDAIIKIENNSGKAELVEDISEPTVKDFGEVVAAVSNIIDKETGEILAG